MGMKQPTPDSTKVDAAAKLRDTGRIDPAECTRRALPPMLGPRRDGFQVIIKQSALNRIHAHGHSKLQSEICGVLVGTLCRDEHGPYLYIEAAITGDLADSKPANVTFTADTWTKIQDEMDRLYPDMKIVGWYHTHPGFGIFLSGMDLFIHEGFFDLPWQVAMVYDPIGGDEGIFVWKQGKAVRQPFLVQDDAVQQRFEVDRAALGQLPLPDEFPADEAPAATAISPTRQRWVYVTLAVFVFLLLITILSILAAVKG